MFLLTRRGKYGHLRGTSVMGRETIHKGMEFGVCPEDPDLHKSCPGDYVCSERSSSEKWSYYGRSEVENSRNHPGRSCHLSDEETEVHAGAATWQSILWTSSWVHRTELHVLLLGTQITFSCSSDFCFWAKAMKSEAMPISHSCILPWAK